MNENSKTFSLIAAAAAVLCLAFVTRPAPPAVVNPDVVGKSLFPDLSDPAKAKRMKIITFDETTSQPREFEVAQVDGVWSLPSHHNYPADAKTQLADAAGALVDLKVLGLAGTDNTQAGHGKGTQAEHELYGVIEPKLGDEQFGSQGVGKLVVIEDAAGKVLAHIIIGKEDKPTKPDEMGMGQQSQLRFVRIPGQEQVYRVLLKADKFSTKFQDWIETDLLKMNPWDVSEVRLRDYSVISGLSADGKIRQGIDQRADVDLTFDDKAQTWKLKDYVNYRDQKPKELKLDDDDELNSIKLNDMKSGLTGLKIIDVAKKPTQMSASLKADKDIFDDDEALQDLARHGFLPARVGPDSFDIVSNDGEAVVSMKDGVQYVLRFGKVAGIDMGNDDAKAEGGKGKAEDDKAKSETAADENSGAKKDKGGLSRYIMVAARFNPELLPKPELEPLPEIKKPGEKPAAGKAATGEKKADGAKSPDAKAAAPKADAKSDAKDAKKDTPKADAKAGDAKAAPKSSDAKSSDAKSDAKSADAKSDTGEDIAAQEEERDRIEKENQRKQAAYDDKVKAGENKAKELNSRFADWYYVVGDDTYKKIHLGQADIIKKKAKDDKNAAGATPPPNPFNINAIPGLQAVPAGK